MISMAQGSGDLATTDISPRGDVGPVVRVGYNRKLVLSLVTTIPRADRGDV